MIAYAAGWAKRKLNPEGRADIETMDRALNYAATMDTMLLGLGNGRIICRSHYQLTIKRSPRTRLGNFALQVSTPDGKRVIGTIYRQRPPDAYRGGLTYRVLWA